jgi:glycosyltransferase involved in cell wall biosynthesis
MSLCAYSGTETAIRDLALGFQAVGHRPMIYSPLLGELAEEIAAAGIPVAADLDRLPEPPDIIHGQHFVQTLEALAHFSKAPAVFVCHDRRAWHDDPPRLNRIRRYVAVDCNCRERLADEARLPAALIRVIYNAIDLQRFQPRSPLPPHPRRALIFSHYAGRNSHLEPIQAACAKLNLPVEVVGLSSSRVITHPERMLGQYDLVFAKARAAMEAMAVGAAVILCDRDGLGQMVTAAEVPRLRPWNFGWRLLQQPLEAGRIVQEIQRYDPADAAAVSRYIRAQAGLPLALTQYTELYTEVVAEWLAAAPTRSDETTELIGVLLPKVKALGVDVIRLHSEREHFRGELLRLQAAIAEQDGILARPIIPRWLAPPLRRVRRRLLPDGSLRYRLYRRVRAAINRILLWLLCHSSLMCWGTSDQV